MRLKSSVHHNAGSIRVMRQNEPVSKPKSLVSFWNVQLHEKHLKTFPRVHLLATFHTLQRQQQRHSLCNTQQWSHHHKRVLYKWEQQMAWHFLGGCWGHVLPTCQEFQSRFWTMVQWEWSLAILFIWQMCFHHSWLDTFIWCRPQVSEISIQNCAAFESREIWLFPSLFLAT